MGSREIPNNFLQETAIQEIERGYRLLERVHSFLQSASRRDGQLELAALLSEEVLQSLATAIATLRPPATNPTDHRHHVRLQSNSHHKPTVPAAGRYSPPFPSEWNDSLASLRFSNVEKAHKSPPPVAHDHHRAVERTKRVSKDRGPGVKDPPVCRRREEEQEGTRKRARSRSRNSPSMVNQRRAREGDPWTCINVYQSFYPMEFREKRNSRITRSSSRHRDPATPSSSTAAANSSNSNSSTRLNR